jgi:putative IMPACT (imprinted ancient) family translation regulator
MHLLASSASSIYTIKEPIEVTEIVKKSRFIGKVSPFKTIEDALSIVKQLSEQKAAHNCWAFRSSSIPSYERSSDDGEPGGTAGRPILSALESEGICMYTCIYIHICICKYIFFICFRI